MKSIKLKGIVDTNHRLTAEVPPEVRAGEVEVHLVFPPNEEDPTERQWAAGISREWAAEWDDPREDIYTITDGEPVDGSR